MNWCTLVEKYNNFVDQQLITSVQATNIFNVSEVILTDVSSYDDIKLLLAMSCVASQLTKEIKIVADSSQKQLDSVEYIKNIKWIARGILHLNDKLGLKIIHHKESLNDFRLGKIPRSSYKFCNFNHNCNSNYVSVSKKPCNSQHFVYNSLYADVSSIINYLEYCNKYTKNDNGDEENSSEEDDFVLPEIKINYSEIHTCMKTISFVLKHMGDELINVKKTYCPNEENLDKFHNNYSKCDQNITKQHFIRKL
jgi:hypothetical protein